MSKITSFVFFDLETTGLLHMEKHLTRITELSFVATLRTEIEATEYGQIAPARKLTFLVNPQKPISPKVAKITGLSNELLSQAPTFREKIKNVVDFLSELPKPVCLIAHNGNRFDFKILLAEFKNVGACLPEDLLCVDSLVGFRNIYKETDMVLQNYQTLELTSSQESALMTDDDEWSDLSQEELLEIDRLCLAVEKKEIKPKKKPRKSFTLTALYKRLLNKEEINCHRAEVDCFMLSQCVVATKHRFLPWADNNCKRLSEIQPPVWLLK